METERNSSDIIAASFHNALHHLSLDTKADSNIDKFGPSTAKAVNPQKRVGRKLKHQVADSWEDESISSSSSAAEDHEDIEECASEAPFSTFTSQGTHAPPPTPISPQLSTPILPFPSADTSAAAPRIRPEKQTAVANRMIAGALGLRAPRRTEEQRAYDRAIQEKEMKKREREREGEKRKKEEEERAKKAVWEG